MQSPASNNPLEELRAFLNNDNIAKIAQSISPRLAQFYEVISEHLLKHLLKNSMDSTYQPFIRDALKKFTYDKINSESPMCSQIITTKYYLCFDCNLQSGSNTSCLCHSCFQKGNHKNHNFRVIKSTFAVCDCGNPEAMKVKSFCIDHNQQNPPILHQQCKRLNGEDNQKIISEMRFVFYIFIRISQTPLNFVDSQKKKESFGLCLLNFMNPFIDQSYLNQCAVSSLLTSCYSEDYPPISMEQRENIYNVTILRLVFKKLSNLEAFGLGMSTLLLRLYSVQKLKEQILVQYFDAIFSQPNFLNQKLSNISFQYLAAGNCILVQNLLRKKQLKPFIINGNFSSFAQKARCFQRLYIRYTSLLSSTNSSAIISLLLEDINICELSNYCSIQEQKKHKDIVDILESIYFELLIKIIKTLQRSIEGQNIMKKIIRQTYAFIKTNKRTWSFSVERTFAFAVCAYFKGNIDQLLQISDDRLLQLLGEQNQYEFYQIIDELLKKLFSLTKLQKYNEYKKQISNHPDSKMLISVDHIFAKIFLNILMREKRRDQSQGFKNFLSYLVIKERSMDTLFDLYLQDENSKTRMEEMIGINFLETCLTINNFVYLSETTLNELIAKDYLGYADQKDVFQFLKFITYAYETNNKKQIKKNAESYIKDPLVVENYIKKYLQETRKQMEKKCPKNIFNLSYSSDYLRLKTTKQIHNLYMLKARSKKRSECSTYIFSEKVIEQIVSIFRSYFKRYAHYFKENQSATSNAILINAVQSVVNLHIQTKSQSIKQFIDEALKKNLYNSIQSSDCKQVIEMYLKAEQLLAKQQMQGKNSLQNAMKMFKKQEGRKKIQQKKRQIKEKQSQFLDQIPHEDLEQNNPSFVSCKQCIICKKSSEQNRLNYLCRLRYSNCLTKAMLGINDPVLLITTCGHMIHENCLRSLNNVNVQNLSIKCFLCKSEANILFPDAKTNQFHTEMQIHHLLNHNSWKREIISNNLMREEVFTPKSSLYKSCCYQFLLYAFNYPKYFALKLLPILRQVIKMMHVLNININRNNLNHEWRSNKSLTKQSNILNFIQDAVETLLENSIQKEEDKLIEIYKLKQKFQDNGYPQCFDYLYLIFQKIIKEDNHNSNTVQEIIQAKTKVKNLQTKIFQLPYDLVDLNKQMGECSNCHNFTSKILICYLCSQKICQDCKQKVENHVNSHNRKTFFIKVQRGVCFYEQFNKFYEANPLYLDYVDDPIKNEETEPKKGEYLLSQSTKNRITEEILDDQFEKNIDMFDLIEIFLR